MRIYLAGGFRSGWQKRVRDALPAATILDPSEHGLLDAKEYVQWDLNAISLSDAVLANMEATNPGGYALALELGYAHALGKPIVLVESHPNAERARSFEMVRAIAKHSYHTLEDAIGHFDRELRSSAWATKK